MAEREDLRQTVNAMRVHGRDTHEIVALGNVVERCMRAGRALVAKQVEKIGIGRDFRTVCTSTIDRRPCSNR